MDEKSGRVVPKTKTSKNAFSPVGEEEYRNLISKLTFYDFDALDVVDGVNLVVSFKQSDIPRLCDVVEGYCTLSAYSKYENKLSAFIACIIDSLWNITIYPISTKPLSERNAVNWFLSL